jgi:rhodanese-related sulfurtransferase
MNRWLRKSKARMVVLSFLVSGIAATMSLQLFATPKNPITWADVFAWIKREWPEVPQMNTQELAQRMADGGDSVPLLIDVRARREYEISHLPGAVWAETSHQIEDVLKRYSKHQVIVFYCSAGVRSSRAAARLTKIGYTNVFNLQGSIFQWANEGRPLLRDGKVVDVVHPYDERWGVLLDSRLHPAQQ